ncbi:DNA cytosine methyltransferase [Streptomyces sp. NPDC048241]|uniref:DNA cytosine methyltransferase n=1 Tax=Streptomyces sp. NPDC048241 TaxID=3365521 RepID=UPI003718B6A0
MTLRIGSVCTGYGGLDMAVQQVFGGELAWVSDIDPGACQIIRHRMPGVPNLGDLTTTDWTQVEPVDIFCGGYPCQPFSLAGELKGTADDRHIWPFIARALRVLRPRVAVFENVANHLRIGFDTVLADLASLGFDAEWSLVQADEIGAPHQRRRLFVYATATDTTDLRHHWSGRTRDGRHGPADHGLAPADANGSGRRPQQRHIPAGEPDPAWGRFGPAVRRWAVEVGRPAPWATDDRGRLNPVFVEWMMGLPAGHVTDVPGLTRTAQLKALGNRVVPQQAAAALRLLADRAEVAA